VYWHAAAYSVNLACFYFVAAGERGHSPGQLRVGLGAYQEREGGRARRGTPAAARRALSPTSAPLPPCPGTERLGASNRAVHEWNGSCDVHDCQCEVKVKVKSGQIYYSDAPRFEGMG
jgi:hypothetical protein